MVPVRALGAGLLIHALLFDFDGVIVDTEVATFQSWRDVYAEHGVDLALADWLPAVAPAALSRAPSMPLHTSKSTGRTLDRDDVVARRSRRKAELYIQAPLLPGVRERLEEARQRDLRTAIVTRNREARVRAMCTAVRLEHQWDALLCANDEPTRDKAELYRDALQTLAVPANDALAFEDSPAGVRAARDASVRCVAIPNEITRSATFHDASLVLASLAEQSLGEIIRLVADAR